MNLGGVSRRVDNDERKKIEEGKRLAAEVFSLVRGRQLMAGAAASKREGEREARLLLQLTWPVPAHAGEGSGLHPWAERLGTSVVRGLLQHTSVVCVAKEPVA